MIGRIALLTLLALLPALCAPPRISYATYLGGRGGEIANAVATDADGNYYVAVQTNSPDYRLLPAGQTFGGDLDIVVSKFSAANVLVYATVIGGSGVDTPLKAVVDTDGSLFLAFRTTSTNFPKPSGSTIGGGSAGTGVAKLNPAGTLTAVALLGAAPGSSTTNGLTLDSNRRVWITGATPGFAGQTGSVQANVAGGTDVFVASLNNALTQITYFTYLGGPSDDAPYQIALDAAGSVYLAGESGATGFPTGPSKAFPGAGIFILKLDPVANRILFASYIGAGIPHGMVLDNGDVWACGAYTGGTDLATTSDALQPKAGGSIDAFLVRVNGTDGQLRYASYLGGSGGDFANGLARDPSGNLIVYGNTTSPNFPITADAMRRSGGPGITPYVAVVDGGGRLVYASYLSGSSGTFEPGLDLALDPLGNAIGIGATNTSDFPTTPGSFQPVFGGVQDGYLIRIEFVSPADVTLGRTAIQNAASFRGGAVAPGEVVIIYPANAGPQTLVTAALTADRRIATLIGGTRVLFDDTPAPMVYSVAGQMSLVVPYGVRDKSFTRVVVEYNGVKSRPTAIPVAAVAPGVFTIASGTGSAAMINQDGSINSPQKPADRGSVVVFFATGEGQTNPAGVDGRLNEFARLEDFPRPIQAPKVTIGGQPAEILFAGGAPGFLAGLMQFNVRVPDGLTPGPEVPLAISFGNVTSQPGVTLAIR